MDKADEGTAEDMKEQLEDIVTELGDGKEGIEIVLCDGDHEAMKDPCHG